MTISEWNISMFRSINDLGKDYPVLNPVFVILAEYTVYLICLGLIIYWFTRVNKNRMMTIQAVFAFLLAEVFGKIAGMVHSNYQPFAVLKDVNQLVVKAVDNSFPSDHTIFVFSICFSFWLVRKKEGTIWLILAVLVGISRIGVGVHYPLDVLVGATLAILAALIVYWIVPKLAFIKKLLAIYEKIENNIIPSKDKSRGF